MIGVCEHDVQFVPHVVTENAVENRQSLLSGFPIGDVTEEYGSGDRGPGVVGRGCLDRRDAEPKLPTPLRCSKCDRSRCTCGEFGPFKSVDDGSNRLADRFLCEPVKQLRRRLVDIEDVVVPIEDDERFL